MYLRSPCQLCSTRSGRSGSAIHGWALPLLSISLHHFMTPNPCPLGVLSPRFQPFPRQSGFPEAISDVDDPGIYYESSSSSALFSLRQSLLSFVPAAPQKIPPPSKLNWAPSANKFASSPLVSLRSNARPPIHPRLDWNLPRRRPLQLLRTCRSKTNPGCLHSSASIAFRAPSIGAAPFPCASRCSSTAPAASATTAAAPRAIRYRANAFPHQARPRTQLV